MPWRVNVVIIQDEAVMKEINVSDNQVWNNPVFMTTSFKEGKRKEENTISAHTP
jgi:hypothetical protein